MMTNEIGTISKNYESLMVLFTGKKPTKTVLFSYARGLLENQDFLSFQSYVSRASKITFSLFKSYVFELHKSHVSETFKRYVL